MSEEDEGVPQWESEEDKAMRKLLEGQKQISSMLNRIAGALSRHVQNSYYEIIKAFPPDDPWDPCEQGCERDAVLQSLRRIIYVESLEWIKSMEEMYSEKYPEILKPKRKERPQ